jgi:hypothetical protein
MEGSRLAGSEEGEEATSQGLERERLRTASGNAP